ncbi:hypothetical protein CHS0354_015286 [Potamilus streckersoni]|uniref:Uncharacterized protein n=1 Tax=Potamilus streckersoni TaxID=2493646 RepID=A0AAE0S007_9BIVA|nr:hypothetical protein CHS0354_015286 [Potamilus streckersoni]
MTDKPSSDETYKAAQVLQKLLQEHDATGSRNPNSTLQHEKDQANSTTLTPVNAPKQVPQHVSQIPAQVLGQNTRIIYVRPSPQPGTSGQILLECSDVTKSIGIVGGGTLTPEAIAKIVAANAAKFVA